MIASAFEEWERTMIKLFRAGAAAAAMLTAGLIAFGTPAAAADNDHRWGGAGERHADNGWRGNGGRDHDGRWDRDGRRDRNGRYDHDGRRDHGGWGHNGWRGNDHDRWGHGRQFGWRGGHDGRARVGGWHPGAGHGAPHYGRFRGW
jgi:hypothetical protein